MLKMKSAMDQVNRNHPKLIPFLKTVEANAIVPGTVIEVSVTTPEGKKYTANIRVKQSDIDLWNSVRNRDETEL